MGNVLFGVNISGIIAQEIGPGVLPATLIVVTPGTRSATASTSGSVPTESLITGRGFIDDYSERLVDGTVVQRGDKKITLIGDTFTGFPVPKPGDKVTIEGSQFRIVGPVKRDPAAATYECQCRV